MNDVIRFYAVSESYGCFSNFSHHPIVLKGKTWPTSEHYFQAQKFVGKPEEEEVRLAKSRMIAAHMGRSRKRPLRKDWESVKDEARLVDALREGGYARVSLVAEEGGQVVGHILFSDLPIVAPQGTVEALVLAPLSVVPDRQRLGIGSLLIREGLRVCRESGHQIVVVLGHPEFYSRFGFSAGATARLRSPFSGPAFMAVELVPCALEGVAGEVSYPPPFQAV